MTLGWVERWLRTEPSNYYFFFEQLSKLAVWVIICALLIVVPRKWIKKRKTILFFWSLVWVLLLFTSLGTELNGSRAWLVLAWGTIQPWEFFKLGFVLFLASWLLRKRALMNELTRYLWFLLITWFCYSIFVLIPDLGTVYVLAPVSLIMFWYAGWKIQQVLLTIVLWIVMMLLAAMQFQHICFRVDYYLHPAVYENAQATTRTMSWLTPICLQQNNWKFAEGIDRQNKQALLAVGWWWWFGKWYGKGLQKFGYLPEAQSDFIFSALAEEVGLFGIMIILSLYLLLARIVTQKLPSVKDEEDQLIAVGILSLIVMQAFINIAVNIRLLPLTGLTLPFFSHWGSALIINMVELMFLRKILQQKN